MGKKKQKIDLETKIYEATTAYTGNVTLKIQKNNKTLKTIKVKNSATLRFFQGLALAIQNVGESVLNGSFLPSYLDVGNGSRDTNITDTKLQSSILQGNRIPINTLYPEVYKNGDSPIGYIARFVGVIPYRSITSGNIREIGLFADKIGDTLLARIKLDNEISIEQGMSLIVEWNLSFENKG